MPPSLDAGFIGRAKLATLWTSKALALVKIQLQKQSARFAFDIPLLSIPLRVTRPP
jgi:hypothetical protein